MEGRILLVSGPSGSGKSTLISRLLEDKKDEVYFSISSTTRSPRKGEINGINYFFLSKNDFEKSINNGDFLEWAYVHNNYYGTSLVQIRDALKNGKIVILDIDVQGFRIARTKIKDLITSVFITTKNICELRSRLEKRNSETEKSIKKRLENAAKEMEEIGFYDYFLVNEKIEDAYENFKSIYNSIKLKTSIKEKDKILSLWLKEN